MEFIEAFRILNIEETKDENEIKLAYRNLLPNVNPEDDKEGFMKLRNAYETAMEYASMEDAVEDKNAFDKWNKEMSKLYFTPEGKSDSKAWDAIFKNMLLDKRFSFDDIRYEVMIYFTNHIYVTKSIWEILDKNFNIVEDRLSLEDKFDVAYLDYIEGRIANKEYIPLEYIKYRFDKDESNVEAIDEYIIELYMLNKQINTPNTEVTEEDLEKIQNRSYWHPFEEIIKIRYYINTIRNGETVDVEYLTSKVKALIPLVEDYYENYKTIKPYVGEAYYAIGEQQKAYDIWNELIEGAVSDKYTDEQITAFYDLSIYYYEKKDYGEAYKSIESLLEKYYENPKINNMLKKINSALIADYIYKIENGIEDEEYKGKLLNLELGWKYFQNNEVDKAIEVVESVTIDEEIEYDYISLYSRLLYIKQEYEKAIPELLKWYELLMNLPEDPEIRKKRTIRRSLCCSHLSYCYYYNNDPKKAIYYIDKAIQYAKNDEDRNSYIDQKIRLLLDLEDYDQARLESERLLSLDEHYYVAHVFHQCACYNLEMYNEVLDDFFLMEGIFDDYYKKYFYAAQCFCKMGYYEDGLKVINYARENGCMEELDICITELILKKRNCKSDDEKRELLSLCDELIERIDNCENKPLNESEVLYNKVCILYELGEFEETIKYAKQGIEKYPHKAGYNIILGDVYSDDEYIKLNGSDKINEALKYYLSAKDQVNDGNLWLLFSIGFCFNKIGKVDECIKYYEEVVSYNPDYCNVSNRLIRIYMSLYEENYRNIYASRALELAINSAERKGDFDALYKLALVYHKLSDCNNAIKYFNEALKYNDSSIDSYEKIANNYFRMGNQEKAIEYFLKAIELDKEGSYPSLNEYLGYAYESIGEYEKAIESFEACYSKDPADVNFQDIGRCYSNLRNSDKAIETYKKEPEYLSNIDIANEFYAINDFDNAKLYCQKAIDFAENSKYSYRYVYIGDFYLENLEDYDKANFFFDKGLEDTSDTNMKITFLADKVKAMLLAGNNADAKLYAEEAKRLICDVMKLSIEEYCYNGLFSAINRYKVGLLYMGLGEFNKAEEVLMDMENGPLCVHCKHKKCFESALYRSMLYMLTGRKNEARDCIIQAKERIVNDPLVEQLYKRIVE